MATRHVATLTIVLGLTACRAPARAARCASEAPIDRAVERPAALSPEPERRLNSDYQPEAFAAGERSAMVEAAREPFDAFVREHARQRAFVGLAVGVVVDGALVQESYVGDDEDGDPITGQTAFRIGSLSKAFTTSLALALRDEGRLDLDRPATAYLPELGNVLYPTADAPAVTLRHLMTHASGLPASPSFSYGDPGVVVTEARLLAELDGLSLSNVVGTSWSYSNLGIAYAGLIAARAGGSSFEDTLRKRLLEPLGMTRTVLDEGDVPHGALATGHDAGGQVVSRQGHWRLGAGGPAGGIYSTLHDMGRWVAFQLDAYPPRNDPPSTILSRASRRQAHRVAHAVAFDATSKGGELRAYSEGYGMGWFVRQNCRFRQLVFHNGSMRGYFASAYFLPDYGFGVVALTSSRTNTAALAREGLELYVRRGGFTPRMAVPRPELASRTRRALRLAHSWSDAEYERLYDTSFRSIVSSETWRGEMAKLVDRGGECRLVRTLWVKSRDHARFLFECRHGLVAAGGEVNRRSLGFTTFGWSRVESPPSHHDVCDPSP